MQPAIHDVQFHLTTKNRSISQQLVMKTRCALLNIGELHIRLANASYNALKNIRKGAERSNKEADKKLFGQGEKQIYYLFFI